MADIIETPLNNGGDCCSTFLAMMEESACFRPESGESVEEINQQNNEQLEKTKVTSRNEKSRDLDKELDQIDTDFDVFSSSDSLLQVDETKQEKVINEAPPKDIPIQTNDNCNNHLRPKGILGVLRRDTQRQVIKQSSAPAQTSIAPGIHQPIYDTPSAEDEQTTARVSQNVPALGRILGGWLRDAKASMQRPSIMEEKSSATEDTPVFPQEQSLSEEKRLGKSTKKKKKKKKIMHKTTPRVESSLLVETKWDKRASRTDLFNPSYVPLRAEDYEVATLAASLGVPKPGGLGVPVSTLRLFYFFQLWLENSESF